MIRLNEREIPFDPTTSPRRIGELRDTYKPDADILILNGFPVPPETHVSDGDVVQLIKRGEQPSEAELEALMVARHSPGVHDALKQASVGICGVGGLGTMVALCLARMGVGKLVLIDHDVVEPSNLNRQQFFVDQIGMPKVEAMKANLKRVNPYIEIVAKQQFLHPQDYAPALDGVEVACECYDNPVCKAEAFAAARTVMREVPWVMVSGLAGYSPADEIRTRRVRDNVILVGDQEHAAQVGRGLMAPRVAVAAGKQANAALCLLLGVDPCLAV